MEVSIGWGTINSYGDTGSSNVGESSATCKLGISITLKDLDYDKTEMSKEEQLEQRHHMELKCRKLSNWMNDNLIKNPCFLDKMKEDLGL